MTAKARAGNARSARCILKMNELGIRYRNSDEYKSRDVL